MRNELAKLDVVTYLILFFLDIDECEFFPCENNGTCIDLIDDFSCDCAAGFSGETCETSIFLILKRNSFW